ncbi:heavy-metal-associated domain-containing protein [Kribbella sp. NPDC051952]|uniref:heavy-metal-associated domain-containing protein n=1 Tax=Kribbella sp. NPDC051952 TaxID=3154851 RepID=UPI00342C772C
MLAGSGGYDRAAAARVLAGVAGAFSTAVSLGASRRIEVELTPLAGDPLTALQLEYLTTRMVPCRPEQVTSAEYAVSWRDSTGVTNVGHCGPLGAVVPVVAREATLALWQAIAADSDVVRAAGELSDQERSVMAATTTDKDPVEILRVGVDTTARALVQHAYLADQTPYRSAGEFARGLRDSGIFAVVANTWFWGLQSSTYRRGMIPARLVPQEDGTVRYAAETVAILRSMKEQAIADAHEQQYALLPAGEQPRCLANMAVDGVRLLPGLVDVFVETFVGLLDLVRIGSEAAEMEADMDEVFEVPDMTCSHCTNTITGVLESLGVRVTSIDLDTKQVAATFPTEDLRAQSFEAIRGRGYTVVPLKAV